jgi:glycosyltransferase involved in cell wall biosynthesis
VRLGLFVPLFDPRPAGVGVYIEEICRRLIRRFPDYILYTATADVPRSWVEPGRVRTFGSSGLPPVASLTGLRRRLRRLAWLSGPVKRALTDENVDVLFSPVQEAPVIRSVPSVLVMHDLTTLRFPSAYSQSTYFQTRWMLPFMLRRCARIIAVSESTRRDLVGLLGLHREKIEVVGEGYDPATFFPRSADEIRQVREKIGVNGPYLLYAGTFSRHKNLPILLHALRELPRELVCVFVGRRDAGTFSEFEREATRLGVADRLVFPGYVERAELAALMSGASAFVFPSRYEGFGLAPLEALACGAVVVASNVASLPEVIGEAGVLVNGGAGAWAEAISRALRLNRDEVRRAATAQSSRFSWDDAAERIGDILERESHAR